MHLIKARNINDLKYCAELYCAQETDDIIETNIIVSTNNLVTESKNGYFRLLVENDSNDGTERIVGWILAYKVTNQFNGLVELQQQFYTSIYSGVKAVKAVLLAHDDLIAYAEKYRIPVVTSHCSHNDPTFTLCRILGKHGWLTRGYMAYWRTSWHSRPTSRPAASGHAS